MQEPLWKNRAAGRAVVMLLGVLGLALGRVPSTQAHVINCGDDLGPGGLFQLEDDLACPGPLGGRITIRDGAILNLNGHRVTCARGGIGCILLTGERAQLWNGTVEGVLHETIVLEGTGGHTVWNVTSGLADSNIVVYSNHNRLINVSAESVYNSAFAIIGHHNLLTKSMARCPFVVFHGCITVYGDENSVIDNSVSVEQDLSFGTSDGMQIEGNKNRVWLNQVTNREGLGIVVIGTGNDLLFNTALGNILDLLDTNSDCTHNTWRHNIFETSDPACIGSRGVRDKVATK